MPKLLRHSKGVVFCLLAALSTQFAGAQLSTPLGSEYSITGEVPGDQTFPRIAVRTFGGYAVWHDNRTDGHGLGISARKLNSSFSPSLSSFRVNQQGVGDQQRPDVTMLNNGGAAFVWQGNTTGRHHHVWMRIVSSNGTFTTTSDLPVSLYTNGPQAAPVIATLTNGNVVVAWSSMFQDGNHQGIYARVMNPAGQGVGAAFQINQFSPFNQRDAAVAGLADGGFVVVWISENQGVNSLDLNRGTNRVDVYARLYNPAGTARGDEFRVNTSSRRCGTPEVAALAGGGFTVAWSQRDTVAENSWDVYARSFYADGSPGGDPFRVNDHTYGEQYSPQLSSLGTLQMVVWSSLGQDGSHDGVYGRLVYEGAPNGGEFRVNTTTISRQHQPVVVSDKAERFLVVWSSFVGESSFDLLAQRYSSGQPLPRPDAPFVSALSSSRLAVSWPELLGYPIAGYEVYLNDALPPAAPAAFVTGNTWTKTGLAPSSTQTFRLAYVMAGGQRSSLSDPATGTTWGDDENFDGLPDDWQSRHWGWKSSDWPPGNEDSDGDGATNASEYLAGTDPTDPNSVLRSWVTRSGQGRRLNWNTQPGFVYQVQTSADFGATWTDFGAQRFSAGTSDSIPISTAGRGSFYRIIRVR